MSTLHLRKAAAAATMVLMAGLVGCGTPPANTTDARVAAASSALVSDGSAGGVEMGEQFADCPSPSHLAAREDVIPVLNGWLEITALDGTAVREDWVERHVYAVEATQLRGNRQVLDELSLTDSTRDGVLTLLDRGARIYASDGKFTEDSVNPAHLLIATFDAGASFFVGDCREATWRAITPGSSDSELLGDDVVAGIVGSSPGQIRTLYRAYDEQAHAETEVNEFEGDAPVLRDAESLEPSEAEELVAITVVVRTVGSPSEPVILCSETPTAVNECLLMAADAATDGLSFPAWALPGEPLTFFAEPVDAPDGISHNALVTVNIPPTLASKDHRYLLLEADFTNASAVVVADDGTSVLAPSLARKSGLVPWSSAARWAELIATEGGEEIVGDDV